MGKAPHGPRAVLGKLPVLSELKKLNVRGRSCAANHRTFTGGRARVGMSSECATEQQAGRLSHILKADNVFWKKIVGY